MTETPREYLTVPVDPSLPIILGRLPDIQPELKDLSYSPRVKVQGGKGQGREGNEEVIFINGPEDQRILIGYILDNFGYLASTSTQRLTDLEGLTTEDIDDLIRLATPNFQTRWIFDPASAEPVLSEAYIQ